MVLKTFIHIFMVFTLLTFSMQPHYAMTMDHTKMEMESESHSPSSDGQNDHSCCEDDGTMDHHCPDDNCHCEMFCCITAFHYTPSLMKELVLPATQSPQNFVYSDFSLQSPLFPVWTPPDIL